MGSWFENPFSNLPFQGNPFPNRRMPPLNSESLPRQSSFGGAQQMENIVWSPPPQGGGKEEPTENRLSTTALGWHASSRLGRIEAWMNGCTSGSGRDHPQTGWPFKVGHRGGATLGASLRDAMIIAHRLIGGLPVTRSLQQSRRDD